MREDRAAPIRSRAASKSARGSPQDGDQHQGPERQRREARKAKCNEIDPGHTDGAERGRFDHRGRPTPGQAPPAQR